MNLNGQTTVSLLWVLIKVTSSPREDVFYDTYSREKLVTFSKASSFLYLRIYLYISTLHIHPMYNKL